MAAPYHLSLKESLPNKIFYENQGKKVEKRVSCCWSFFQAPLQRIGQILRNAFYLPWGARKVCDTLHLDEKLARGVVQVLKNAKILGSEEMNQARQFFSVRDLSIQVNSPQSRSHIFFVRLFESKIPIGQKRLRIFLFSFNKNIEVQGGDEPRMWNPLTVHALSEAPILVLKALRSKGVQIDSLVTTSLGNIFLDGIQRLKHNELGIVPPVLILNRGLTSVQKVASQLYSFPLNHILHGVAKATGWDANPEQELLNFLNRDPKASQRKVVLIEAKKDFYFSGKGGLDWKTQEKIAELGCKVFRGNFYPFPFQVRAHHAISLNHLKNNGVAEILIDTIPFSMKPEEEVSSAVAREIFLKGNGPCHTCFYICGNDATLDIGTAREVLPLLSSFIKEGEKFQAGVAEDYKEAL